MSDGFGRPRRQSLRLPGYDYSQAGAYFVTIGTQNRDNRFGVIVGERMVLNGAGLMVERWCSEMSVKFPDTVVDAQVIMPNHVHLIVMIEAVAHFERVENAGGHAGPPLPEIVQWLKTMTTNEYIRGVKESGWPRFDGKLWQRSYFERVIRNETELKAVRQYIADNPVNWAMDKDNPTLR